MLAGMAEAARAETTEAPILMEVGQPLCRGILAYARGDYARAADDLVPLAGEIRRLGGSHAQRDVFQRTLIEAAIKAGRLRQARAMLSARTEVLAGNRWGWRRFAEVLAALGDAPGSANAMQRLAALN